MRNSRQHRIVTFLYQTMMMMMMASLISVMMRIDIVIIITPPLKVNTLRPHRSIQTNFTIVIFVMKILPCHNYRNQVVPLMSHHYRHRQHNHHHRHDPNIQIKCLLIFNSRRCHQLSQKQADNHRIL